ncbi:MAG: hypothetical protein ABIG44_16265 [Planctomycetota bacterium]
MAVKKKNRYEIQAKLSFILAIVGGVCTLAGVALVLQRFDFENFQVNYNPRTPRMMAIGGALGLGLLASGLGFLLGLISAGQRLNKRNKLSWTGFFVNASVITLALSCGIFFYLTRFAMEVKEKTVFTG